MYAYPRCSTRAYHARVLFDQGALSRSDPRRQSESWPDRGAPERSMPGGNGGALGGAAPSLGRAGFTLPREVGTLLPPPRVPIGALAPPTAPSPRERFRGGPWQTSDALRRENASGWLFEIRIRIEREA